MTQRARQMIRLGGLFGLGIALGGCGSSPPEREFMGGSIITEKQPRAVTVGSAVITIEPHSEATVRHTDIGPNGNLYRGSAYIQLTRAQKETLSLGALNTTIHATEGSFEVAVDDRSLQTIVTVCAGSVEVLANNPYKKQVGNESQVADGYVPIPAGQRGIVNRKGEVSKEELSAEDCR